MENSNANELKTINVVFKSQSSYQIKEDGTIKKTKNKKRVATEHWTFDNEYYSREKQLSSLQLLLGQNNGYIENLMVQEIKKKIANYKQQDIHKKMFDKTEFLTLEYVVKRLVECDLKCYYCDKNMNILYDIQREASQWSVDRINNELGHNNNNFYLACLECNLKRRCRSDSKFLMTKQMKLVKVVEGSYSL